MNTSAWKMPMRMACLVLMTGILMLMGFGSPAWAARIHVAVAANFHNPFKTIATAFEKQTGHEVRIIPGSTGKLYAQIIHGAPYDLFLAADSKRPALLEEGKKVVPATRFTYALGRITLWSPDPGLNMQDGKSILQDKDIQRIAIANPKTAPYGLAAMQTLKKLGLWKDLRSRLIQGENIGQTFQFVSSRNAPLGFVALSQVLDPANTQPGSRWDVPDDLYDPIRQDAVIIKRAEHNTAARALWEFLQSKTSRDIIEKFGYRLP